MDLELGGEDVSDQDGVGDFDVLSRAAMFLSCSAMATLVTCGILLFARNTRDPWAFGTILFGILAFCELFAACVESLPQRN